MNIPNRVSDLDAPVGGAFAHRARPDWNGFQGVAFEETGTSRYEVQMGWEDREEAAARARWCFGCACAAVGYMDGQQFVITDLFERVRDGGRLKVRHLDLVSGAVTLRSLDLDLSPAGLHQAYADWKITARDYSDLRWAYRVVGGEEPGPGDPSPGGALRPVAAAHAVIRDLREKWGFPPGEGL